MKNSLMFLRQRLAEPSTWAGLGLVASQALLALGTPGAAAAAALVGGVAAVFTKEGGK